MTKVNSINVLGGFKLPRGLRKLFALPPGVPVIAEAVREGVLLRVGSGFPVEIYSDQRVAEFKRNNEDALAGYRLGR